jgi:hypothetical protein
MFRPKVASRSQLLSFRFLPVFFSYDKILTQLSTDSLYSPSKWLLCTKIDCYIRKTLNLVPYLGKWVLPHVGSAEVHKLLSSMPMRLAELSYSFKWFFFIENFVSRAQIFCCRVYVSKHIFGKIYSSENWPLPRTAQLVEITNSYSTAVTLAVHLIPQLLYTNHSPSYWFHNH